MPQTSNYRKYVLRRTEEEHLFLVRNFDNENWKQFENIFIKGLIEYSKFLNAQTKKYKILVWDETTVPFIRTFVRWFLRSPLFLSDEFGLLTGQEVDMDKGLLLIGCPGAGKSYLFKLVQGMRNPVFFKWVDCRNMPLEFDRKGTEALDSYVGNNPKRQIFFDDMGDENTAAHFGTKINIMREVLKAREAKDMITHATSNATIEELGARYGRDVESRFYSMFNIIELPSRDWRRPNKCSR